MTAFALAGCSWIQPSLTPEEYVSKYGGDLRDYVELAESRDCDFLANAEARGANNLEDFGDRKWDGYCQAASQRYEELRCTVE